MSSEKGTTVAVENDTTYLKKVVTHHVCCNYFFDLR